MDKETVLDEIRKLNKSPNSSDPPKYKELEDFSGITHSQVQYRFGSWTEALEKAGIEPRNRNVTREELLNEIERLSEKHRDGKPPREKDVSKHSDYSIRPYYSEFGTWNNALDESSIDSVNQNTNISKNELIEEIERVFNEDGVLTFEKFSEKSDYSKGCYQRRFSTFGKAVKEAGFQPVRERNIPEKELLNAIKELSDDVNGRPSINDMENTGKYSMEIYFRRFDSWENAIGKAGFSSYSYPKGREHNQWKGGFGNYYGPSWSQRREDVLERDGYQCRICSCSKKVPSVHHITPVRYWDVDSEHEKMNHPRNLICLCRSCHHRIEGRIKGRNHLNFEKLAKENLPTQ
jgi:5-methylcytosine-specific restriction endonuclease McrA